MCNFVPDVRSVRKMRSIDVTDRKIEVNSRKIGVKRTTRRKELMWNGEEKHMKAYYWRRLSWVF